MLNKNILCYLTLTFRACLLRGRLYSFCGTWQRCSQRLGMGRPGASHEGPRAAGIGQRRGCRDRVHGAGIPLRGRTFLRKALLLPSRSRPGASHEGPRAAGIGQRRGAATAFHGACIPLRGRTSLWKALLLPSRSRHSASLRLVLHPKNHTLHPVQLPDLGLSTPPPVLHALRMRISVRCWRCALQACSHDNPMETSFIYQLMK
jgi:hypothetical protein